MLDIIRSSSLEIVDAFAMLPDWIAATALLGGSALLALIVHSLIVQALRSTFGVRHPKTRASLTRRLPCWDGPPSPRSSAPVLP